MWHIWDKKEKEEEEEKKKNVQSKTYQDKATVQRRITIAATGPKCKSSE